MDINNFLNFYHEFRTPQNAFFENVSSDYRLLMISAPSRMGNHLLHSTLDSHSMLPRIPGEDGNLFHYFKFSTLAIQEFFDDIKPEHLEDTLQRYASTGGKIRKWEEFKSCFDTNTIPKVWSGIQYPTDSPYITDYQNVVFDVNLEAYQSKISEIAASPVSSCAELVTKYYSALNYLDYTYDPRKEYKFDGICFASGMRGMASWMLKHFRHSKLITTVRDFDSYAISHIRSRYKTSDLRNEWVREAWEHWFHKIGDYVVLKRQYPDRVFIVRFEDLINEEKSTIQKICDFLDVEYESTLDCPTAFGLAVKGNSSAPKSDKDKGKRFGKRDVLPPHHDAFPKEHDVLRRLIVDYLY